MKRLTSQEVLDTIGEQQVYRVGETANNRYFMPGPVHKYINEKLKVAHRLSLPDAKQPKRILDIGTGAGWFPYICGLYGHDATGTDVPDRPEYEPCYQLLKIKTSPMLVYSMQPMQLDGVFDIITSLRSFFPQRPRAWEKSEFKFWLADARDHLAAGGCIYLATNSGSKLDKRYKMLPLDQRSHWGNVELGAWFQPFLANPTDVNDRGLLIQREQIQSLLDT